MTSLEKAKSGGCTMGRTWTLERDSPGFQPQFRLLELGDYRPAPSFKEGQHNKVTDT